MPFVHSSAARSIRLPSHNCLVISLCVGALGIGGCKPAGTRATAGETGGAAARAAWAASHPPEHFAPVYDAAETPHHRRRICRHRNRGLQDVTKVAGLGPVAAT